MNQLATLESFGIQIVGGRVAKSIKDSLVAQGLKGQAKRARYYEITRACAADTSAVQGEFDARGFLKEVTSIRHDKSGEIIGGSVRYFRPVTPKANENAKDKKIAELEAQLAEMRAKKA
jgi:hypothetical protein